MVKYFRLMKLGTSVRRYMAQNPTPKRPVLSGFRFFVSPATLQMFLKSSSEKVALL